jgi:hypothetical protein
MATQNQLFQLPGMTADANLSAKQFYFVVQGTTKKRVGLASVDGEVVDGVLQNKPNASGQVAEVMSSGLTKVVAGETLSPGDLIKTGSDGKALIAEGTITGADLGDYVVGRCYIGAASGEIATISIGLISFRVEAQ